MKQLILACLAATALILAACESGNEPNGAGGNNNGLWNMKVGNSWTYEVVKYNGSGMNNLSVVDTINISVTAKVIINGEEWYRFVNSNNESFLYANRDQSLWQYMEAEQKPILVRKYPTYVGELCRNASSIYKTEGVREKMTTPAGTFECVVYSRWNEGEIATVNGIKDIYCYCPGNGLTVYKRITDISYGGGRADTLWVENRLIGHNIK
ncbi:MAG: hypothetical protein ACM3U1_01690 [Chloroflexota bacterium]